MTLTPGTRFYLKEYRKSLRDKRIFYEPQRYIIRKLHGEYIECDQQVGDFFTKRVFVNRTSALNAIASGQLWRK